MLDKSVVCNVWWSRPDFTEQQEWDMDDLLWFAQAIYALGVKDERERLAKKFDEAGWHPYAEVIRG